VVNYIFPTGKLQVAQEKPAELLQLVEDAPADELAKAEKSFETLS
jgi:hypothetical protein